MLVSHDEARRNSLGLRSSCKARYQHTAPTINPQHIQSHAERFRSRTISLGSNVRHLSIGVDLGEILLVAFGSRLDGLITWVPVGGADLKDQVSIRTCIYINVACPHTSPYLSVNWKASIKRSVSSTDRPTGRSLMVICRTMPLGSIRKSPRRAIPSSSIRTP